MSKVNLTISMENKDKEMFNDLVQKLGINISSAINMFIKQSIRNQALPLDLSITDDDVRYAELDRIADEIMEKYDLAFKELAK
ncbi:MAG: type II toxin-antitoxin system RelB/DinJ family antitoxin [Peptoniphilus grossensis]|uniref:type II toxin-antitoxin system RelB/DinJ family antitoxin n=1 Tax=Peptoniphilus grossensis TaxID=1465756 RepID=UPI002585685A|nr:type II toxin-antitoxin system RelB/DinJ family antitoxin [Peptoniphilus grossensis]MDU5100268.1 type II toxin-antitoxin system RelB/DinJ family antitoxin [Peptoniphilus grossensis]